MNTEKTHWTRIKDGVAFESVTRTCMRASLAGRIIGECLALDEDDYHELLQEIASQIHAGKSLWDTNLRERIEAIEPRLLVVAAVFFVRYDYSYKRDGFWRPFLEALSVDFTQSHRLAVTRQLDKAFRILGLYRPKGGYRYVSPLIYHCVLPNDGIRHVADILAHQEPNWSYWASADAETIVAFLRECRISSNMKRLLDHDGWLVADLFADVCDYLATGRPSPGTGCGLDVEAIAATVQQRREENQSASSSGTAPTRKSQWHLPPPKWVWRRTDSRIGLRVPSMTLPGEVGSYVAASLKVGSHELPLNINMQNQRTEPVFVDSWFLDMGAANSRWEIVSDGNSRAERMVPMLDRTAPMVELKGALVPLKSNVEVPTKAWWLLPPGTTPKDGITKVVSVPAPFPLNQWSAGLFETTREVGWSFKSTGLAEQDFECSVESSQSWFLDASSALGALHVEGFAGPVLTEWPVIELLGTGWGKDILCEVRNVFTGEQHTYRIEDVAEGGRESGPVASHRNLCCEFSDPIGCFRVKAKSSNFRTIRTAEPLEYCFLPLKNVSIPHAIRPGKDELELTAEVGGPLQGRGLIPLGGANVENSNVAVGMRWPRECEPRFQVGDEAPFSVRLDLPCIGWSLGGEPQSECITVSESEIHDSGKRLVISTDPELPAQIEIGDWREERPADTRQWVLPFTTLYEQVEKATSRQVSVYFTHADGQWEALRVRRDVTVTSVMCNHWSPAIYTKVQLSAKTDSRLFAIAAQVGNVSKTLTWCELDPAGQEGGVLDAEGTDRGTWRIVFLLGDEETPQRAELLRDGEGHIACGCLEGTDVQTVCHRPEPEPGVAEELLACGEWGLPLSLFAPEASLSKSDTLRNKLLTSLTGKTGQHARCCMEHLAGEGTNFASFSPAAHGPSSANPSAESLAELWQPLAVPQCTNPNGAWAEGMLNIFGCPHEHPLFLPRDTEVRHACGRCKVTGGHERRVIEGTTYDCFEVELIESGDVPHYLVFGNRDHHAALVPQENLPFVEEDDVLPLRRIACDAQMIGPVLDKNLGVLLRSIYDQSPPAPFLPIIFAAVNERQPAYRQELLLKGYWQWKNDQSALQKRAFADYWESTRMDCAGVYGWLRDHLGEEEARLRENSLFGAQITPPCREILISVTHQLEEAFPFHHDDGAYAYPGFIFVLALYNRLAARFPDRIPTIRPHSEGRKWLWKHSAMAFRHARLMFNYWLVLSESILNWWSPQETGGIEK